MSLLSIDHDLSGHSYYRATSRPNSIYPALDGAIQCDVAIVGGGVAGLSAALELAEKGYDTVLLEAREVGWGGSGRNGGQALPGFSCDQKIVEGQLGLADARKAWNISLEGVELIRERMRKYGIDCDWRDGYLSLATSTSKAAHLMRWVDRMEQVYGTTYTRIHQNDIRQWIDSPRFFGGFHDPHSGHLHPLKYSWGLAAAAARAGARLHERTAVTSVEPHARGVVSVETATGTVMARQVLLAGNIYLQNVAPRLERRILPISTYIIGTEPIDACLCDSLIPTRSAACDTNIVLDYFRPSPDHRMLYGCRVGYGQVRSSELPGLIHKRMAATFPQLSRTKIEYAWGGFVDVTLNRAPDFGRLAPNLYYLQGFSGHGLALAGAAGKLVAEAMDGDASRFDVFSRLKHRDFPGGRWMRKPALFLGMTWYRLRDRLG